MEKQVFHIPIWNKTNLSRLILLIGLKHHLVQASNGSKNKKNKKFLIFSECNVKEFQFSLH